MMIRKRNPEPIVQIDTSTSPILEQSNPQLLENVAQPFSNPRRKRQAKRIL